MPPGVAAAVLTEHASDQQAKAGWL